MSWTSPLTVASTIVPLPWLSVFSMCGSRWATAFFITSADCSTNGSCICPDPNSSPTVFIPDSSVSLMISRAGRCSSAASRSASSPFRSPSTIRRSRRSNSGSAGQLLGAAGLRSRGGDALEQLHEPAQRVVTGPAPVVDEVQRDRALLVVDLGHGQDLRRRHDRGVQPGVHALVQEHRVQHLPGGGVEPERHVRDAQRGLHAGVPALELADRLDRLQRVPADLLLPGGDREGEGVDDDVLDVHAVVRREVADQPVRDPDLPVGGARLALLVDAQRDDRGAVLPDQRHRPLEARAGPVAVLVVHRVDDRAPAQALQPGEQHVRLGGVEHDRQGGRGGQPAGQLRHVRGAVAARRSRR